MMSACQWTVCETTTMIVCSRYLELMKEKCKEKIRENAGNCTHCWVGEYLLSWSTG